LHAETLYKSGRKLGTVLVALREGITLVQVYREILLSMGMHDFEVLAKVRWHGREVPILRTVNLYGVDGKGLILCRYASHRLFKAFQF
jgi:hypothetical protein